jgi:AraC-like DNA-binding protein
MKHRHFSTRDVPANHEFGHWREVIADAYFNLQLGFHDDQRFRGELQLWELNTLQLSRLESSGLSYRRLRQHCQLLDRQVLVTVPLKSDVEFTQLGRTSRCAPGQFLLELSEEPYEFGHRAENDMWVLKVPAAALKARVGDPSRFCARAYDRESGVGQLFGDYLSLLTRHCEGPHGDQVRSLMGTQLIDLLGLALQEHPDALMSQQSAVRDAHLSRVEAHVRQHLAEPELAPQTIADACGISVRYLHLLFKDTGGSVSQWIRELRLQAAHEALTRAADRRVTIAQIAYSVGFADQAQFSHAFRRKFNCTPSELLRESRGGL